MQPGDVIAGRFRVDHLAGSGGMGAVYAATDVHSGARVALKLLHATITGGGSRFVREAKVLSDIRHPGIVRYVAHGDAGAGRLFLAMEWLVGEELSARLARGPLSPSETATLGIRVGEALGAAHARGVVHRDVKPQNLFLVGGSIERCKVLDFGVARLGAPGSSSRAGAVVGTPAYMSPEQARGEPDVDPRADVFSLACVLYECLTGAPPFCAHSPLALLAKILHEEVPRVRTVRPDVPEALDAAIARALSKDPAHRPATGAAFAADLAPVLGHVTSPPSSPRKSTLVPERPAGGGDALGAQERRFLSVVLAALFEQHDPAAVVARAHAAVAARGARLDPLAGGALLVTVPPQRSAMDQATQAARCALALASLGISPAIAIGTGRGDPSSDWPFAEAVERAAAALQAPHDRGLGGVRVDDVTHGLLDARFDVRIGPAGPEIVGERLLSDVGRSVLGVITPFVGRDRELGMLEGTFLGALGDATARAVVLTGPPGSGKSRLLAELLRRVTAHCTTPKDARLGDTGRTGTGASPLSQPPEVWLLRGDPSAASASLSALAAALRRALDIPRAAGAEARERLVARLARSLSGDELSLASDFIGEMLGLAPPDDDRPVLRAARADPMFMSDQLARAWDAWLSAERTPLVIAVDDLEHCDAPSIRFLDLAMRAATGRALFVVAAGRPEARQRFPALLADRGAAEVRLSPLTRRACKALARAVLGPAAPETLLDDLAARSEGNALYLEELVRLVAMGERAALPETLLAMVHFRIDRLEVEAKRLLRAASVFGYAFWRGGVVALLGGAERDALVGEWLDELCERELCAPRAGSRLAGQQEYAFVQPLLRDAAYATLTEQDRRLGHRIAAEWLEANGEPDAAVLAHHHEQACETERAARWYHRAAALALEGNDFDGALVLAERARAAGTIEGEALAALLLLRAEALVWRGALAEAADCGVQAMALARPHGALWYKAAGGTLLLAANVGRFDTIVGVLDGIRAGLSEPAAGPRVMAWALAAWLLAMLGVRDLLTPFAERLDRAHASISSSDFLAGGWACLGRFFVAMIADGEAAAAVERAREAIAWFDAAGDVRNATNARIHLGWALLGLGDLEGAERALRESIATAERRNLPHLISFARRFLGPVLARQGRVEAGVEELTAAMTAFAAAGNRYLEASARVQLAVVLVSAGRASEAEAHARSALGALAATPPALGLAHAVLARALIVQGATARALEAAEEAMRIWRSFGLKGEHEMLVRLAHAGALHAAGRTDEFGAAVLDAARRVTERADRIRDPEMRRRFLAVPENRQTLEMARGLASTSA